MTPIQLVAHIKAEINSDKKPVKKYSYRITAFGISHSTDPTGKFEVLTKRATHLLTKLHKDKHITSDKLITELTKLKHVIAELNKK
jgi:hypothetical protein